MHAKPTRRAVLSAAAALSLAPSWRDAAAQTTRLRMTWWGGADRARRTRGALDAWQRLNPGAQVDSETVGWADYWTRLATQVAGGNAPDVIQMDYRYIHEYARRRALRALDDMMPDPLDIRDFGEANIETGKVDGRVFGVSMGVNSTAMIYDTTVFERLNIRPPTAQTTWAQFAEIATAVTRGAARRGFFGTEDGGMTEPLLEVFVRGRGRTLYGEDGKLGFTRDDVAEWFDYWDRLRRANVATPGDMQALYRQTPETSMLVTNRAPIAFSHSNLLIAHQGLTQNKLGMTAYPRGDRPGQYYKPSMLLSLSSTASNPREAARLIGFLSVAPEAGEHLGVERGVPPSAARREALAATVPEGDRIQIAYIAAIADAVSPLPPPPPRGAGEVANLLRRTNEKVAFGQLRVPAAADEFMNEAVRALERA
jgi:multiple sugar transport system substrate-binding protein